jgi:hypothetical protein
MTQEKGTIKIFPNPLTDKDLDEIRATHSSVFGAHFFCMARGVFKSMIIEMHQQRGALLQEVDRLRAENRRLHTLLRNIEE